jgi:hypothetical protein
MAASRSSCRRQTDDAKHFAGTPNESPSNVMSVRKLAHAVDGNHRLHAQLLLARGLPSGLQPEIDFDRHARLEHTLRLSTLTFNRVHELRAVRRLHVSWRELRLGEMNDTRPSRSPPSVMTTAG